MSGLRLLPALLLLAPLAHGAEVTRIASSGDPDHPFGFFLDAAFERTQHRGKITREWYQSGTNVDVDELRFQHLDTRLNLDAYIGLYQDLQFHFQLPIVFQDDRAWGFAGGTDPGNTTLYRNCLNPDGSTPTDGTCPAPGSGSGRLFTVDENAKSFRSGLGNLTFGLAYAFFKTERDDTKPTWVVSFDYTAPTAPVLNPSAGTSNASRGTLGDKVHRYKFATTISKRISIADPYFGLWYTLPWLGPGYYSNCDDASPSRMGRPDNCGVGMTSPSGRQRAWSRDQTGLQPPHTGGFFFGSEIVVFENPRLSQKVAFDLRGFMTYTAEGRVYNELSDLFGKLLYTQDHLTLGGHLGFTARAAEYVHLKAYAKLAYDTEHFLTREEPGEDFNENGSVDFTSEPREINPNYDWRIDHPGRRFRISEQVIFNVYVAATFAF